MSCSKENPGVDMSSASKAAASAAFKYPVIEDMPRRVLLPLVEDASQVVLVALVLAREWDNETATRPVAKKVLRHDLEET
jgi:hypothetical protein